MLWHSLESQTSINSNIFRLQTSLIITACCFVISFHVATKEIENIHDHVANEKIESINDHVANEKIESINDHGAKKVESIETNTKYENSSKKVKSTCKRFCCTNHITHGKPVKSEKYCDPNDIGLLINKAMTDVEKYALISTMEA